MIQKSRQEVVQLIRDSEGKVFNVQFIKKGGGIRSMNCRLGYTVKKGLKGGELPYNPMEKGLIPAYLMYNDESYQVEGNNRRMINEDTILSVSIDGSTYNVQE